MTISAQLAAEEPHKLFVSNTDRQAIDWRVVRRELAELAEQGRITDRDERLLEILGELSVLSLDQVHRLLFRRAKQSTAYYRLHRLSGYRLTGSAVIPRAGMAAWELPTGNVYTLGPAGWLWLKRNVDSDLPVRHLHREQVLHDLLVAEIYTRLAEAAHHRGPGWSIEWTGERGAGYAPKEDNNPVLSPDGLAVVRRARENRVATFAFFLELDAGREAHGRPSSRWGRKVVGYDQFAADRWQAHPALDDLPAFPAVAVVTHGEKRLLNLVESIVEKRRKGEKPVTYYLARWPHLLAAEDLLTAPVWLVVGPEGVAGEKPEERRPLLPVEKGPAAKG